MNKETKEIVKCLIELGMETQKFLNRINDEEEISYFKKCWTCKHFEKTVSEFPCDTCKWANTADNWEPKERPKPKRKDLGILLKRMDELAEQYEQRYY